MHSSHRSASRRRTQDTRESSSSRIILLIYPYIYSFILIFINTLLLNALFTINIIFSNIALSMGKIEEEKINAVLNK